MHFTKKPTYRFYWFLVFGFAPEKPKETCKYQQTDFYQERIGWDEKEILDDLVKATKDK